MLSTSLNNRILASLRHPPLLEIRTTRQINYGVVFMKRPLVWLASRPVHCAGAVPLDAPDPKVEIEDMITKYSVGPGDAGGRKSAPSRPHGHAVLLTGSTGGLGSHLLASLLSREDVAVVYAFNRPSKIHTIQDRQCATFQDRGLDASILDSEKLVFIEGDATRENLSLDDGTYAKICDSVTVIIHNAWRLNFNHPLSSFEPNIMSTRHLINLARASRRSARFLFTSSVSSMQGWDERKGAVPEEVQFDAGVAVGHGYGASKYVSERIVAVSGLSTTSFRIGQIVGGSPRGAWSTNQWVPMIVKSSVTLGAFPDARGVISWLPPHAVSSAISSVALAEEQPPAVVNLVHPRPITWTSLMQHIRDAVYQRQLTSSPLPLVPFSEWVARLNRYAVDTTHGENIKCVPAIKLINLIRSLADSDEALRRKESGTTNGPCADEAAGIKNFATDVAQRVSGTMQTLKPLSAVDAVQWVNYWVSTGMFSDVVEVRL